jgi:hypothetical protein
MQEVLLDKTLFSVQSLLLVVAVVAVEMLVVVLVVLVVLVVAVLAVQVPMRVVLVTRQALHHRREALVVQRRVLPLVMVAQVAVVQVLWVLTRVPVVSAVLAVQELRHR